MVHSFDRPERLRADNSRLNRIPHRRRQRRANVARYRGGYYQNWAEEEAARTGVPTLGVLQDVSEGSARMVSGMTAPDIVTDDGDVFGTTAANPESVNFRFDGFPGGGYRIAAGAVSTQFTWGSDFQVGDWVQIRVTNGPLGSWENYTPYQIKSIEPGTNRMYFGYLHQLPAGDDFTTPATSIVAVPADTKVCMVKVENWDGSQRRL